jgi:hypothetical protein
MQISAAPRDTEIERLMRGAGIDPQSEDGQAIYRDLLRHRREGSGMSEMARSIANMSAADSGRAQAMARFAPPLLAEAERLRLSAEASQRFVSVADDLLQAMDEAGGVALFGAAGVFRRNVTGLSGTLEELAGVTGDEAGAAQTTMSLINNAVIDARASNMNEEVFEQLFGNSAIQSVELLANALSYLNARIYEPTGPLTAADIRAHQIDPGVLGSTRDAVARINTVIQRAQDEHQRNRQNMMRLENDPEDYFFSIPDLTRGRGPSGQPPAPGAPAAQQGESEMVLEFDPATGTFNRVPR